MKKFIIPMVAAAQSVALAQVVSKDEALRYRRTQINNCREAVSQHYSTFQTKSTWLRKDIYRLEIDKIMQRLYENRPNLSEICGRVFDDEDAIDELIDFLEGLSRPLMVPEYHHQRCGSFCTKRILLGYSDGSDVLLKDARAATWNFLFEVFPYPMVK